MDHRLGSIPNDNGFDFRKVGMFRLAPVLTVIVARNRSLDEYIADSAPTSNEGDSDTENRDDKSSQSQDIARENGSNEAVDEKSSSDSARSPPSDSVKSSGPDSAEIAVEPVQSTYSWSPEGHPCSLCGDSVQERWREGGELLCEACKEW